MARCLAVLLMSMLFCPAAARSQVRASGLPGHTPHYDAIVLLADGNKLVGRVVEEDLSQLVLQIEGTASAPITLDKTQIRRIDAVHSESGTRVVAAAEPPAPKFSGRLLGLGTNLAVGIGYNSTLNVWPDGDGVDFHDDIELPGLEFRIFPNDRLSIDFLWQIGDMTWLLEHTGEEVASMLTFVHFYVADTEIAEARAGFSVAPGILTASNLGDPKIGAFGGGLRLGLDLTSLDDRFGFGAYARPLFYVIRDVWGDNYGNFELMLELTWTWYVPRPLGV